MKIIAIVVVALTLSGCSTVEKWIPSFWDDNQSAKITDVRLRVDRLDCKSDQLAQITVIRDDLRWFELYSHSKGRLQKDVLRLIGPMQETVEDMYKRNSEGKGSVAYCELKKKIMLQQAERAAIGILGRY
jgi:outer membrane murein-binding lipoprotein Lpp